MKAERILGYLQIVATAENASSPELLKGESELLGETVGQLLPVVHHTVAGLVVPLEEDLK